MAGFGRGRGARGGAGRGGGIGGVRDNSIATSSFRDNSPLTTRLERASQPQSQPQASWIQTVTPSETRKSRQPRQETSFESQSSRIVVESVHPTTETENDVAASCNISKKGRGRYKSLLVDMKTKHGSKIPIIIPDDIERAVGPGSRDIVNYCGLIMHSTISFRDSDWQEIITKHGDVMWLKVKDKFEATGVREHVLQALVVNNMKRLFRTWKTRLHAEYSRYTTDEERLSHRPSDVTPEDWVFLLGHFGSPEFKAVSERNKINRGKQITKHSCGSKSFAEVEESTRDPISGQKAAPDRVWELQHTRKNDNEELVWSDPQSQQIHVQLQEIVEQQQSEENPMNADEILVIVLGERTGYVRGKGYGKRPTKKSRVQQVELEASMSSAMENMRQKMEAEMDKKLQEEREQAAELQRKLEEQMAAELQRKLEDDRLELQRKLEVDRAELQRKLEEERAHMNLQLDKRIQEMATMMVRIQREQRTTRK